MTNIAIFASGSGTNAQRIIEYFHTYNDINVTMILSNNPNAFVIERAKKFNIKSYTFQKDHFYNTDYILLLLKKNNINFIVLAGFLWLVPDNITEAYPRKIINIHPSLLPKYGGKGMYGMKIHTTVKENKETETGITIHYITGKYDQGAIIFQAKCSINNNDRAEDIADKVHQLEYKYFPKVIHDLL